MEDAVTENIEGATGTPVGASDSDPQTTLCIAYKAVPQGHRNTDEGLYEVIS